MKRRQNKYGARQPVSIQTTLTLPLKQVLINPVQTSFAYLISWFVSIAVSLEYKNRFIARRFKVCSADIVPNFVFRHQIGFHLKFLWVSGINGQ